MNYHKIFNKSLVALRAALLVSAVMLLVVSAYAPASAQGTDAQKDTVMNEAMKTVFSEVKKDLKGNETMGSIAMIAGVILIVGIAMYLSFKPSKKTAGPSSPQMKPAGPAISHIEGRRR